MIYLFIILGLYAAVIIFMLAAREMGSDKPHPPELP